MGRSFIKDSLDLYAPMLRMDAQETATFARALEFIYTQTYDILYPELKARRLIPVDTSPGPAADYFTYRSYDKVGEATIVHNYASDMPTAEVYGSEFKQKIVSLGASYHYSIQDLRAAAFAGVPLEAKKAEAARFAIEQKLESLAFLGDTKTGLYGLTNAPNITAVTQVSSGTWAAQIASAVTGGTITATAQAIAADVNAMQKQIVSQTKGVHEPDTLVLPTDCYTILATTPRAPGFTDDTILQFVLKQSPWLKSIEWSPRLDKAGASSKGRIMMYKKDPAVLSLIIGQDFEQLPPQPRGMSFVIPCHARTGAVEVRYPLAVAYMDGPGA